MGQRIDTKPIGETASVNVIARICKPSMARFAPNRGKRVRHHARLWFAFTGCSDLLFSSVTHFFAQDNVALLCRTCGKSFWQGALKHSQLTISEKNWLMSNLDSGGEVRNDIHTELEYMMF